MHASILKFFISITLLMVFSSLNTAASSPFETTYQDLVNAANAKIAAQQAVNAAQSEIDSAQAILDELSSKFSNCLVGCPTAEGYFCPNPCIPLDQAELDAAQALLTVAIERLAYAQGQLAITEADFLITAGSYILAGGTLNDTDNDGVYNVIDNCPNTTNADQLDTDNDALGDVCDSDFDGVPDDVEALLGVDNTTSTFQDLLNNLNEIVTAKNVPSMGDVGLLVLGLSMLGLGAARLRGH